MASLDGRDVEFTEAMSLMPSNLIDHPSVTDSTNTNITHNVFHGARLYLQKASETHAGPGPNAANLLEQRPVLPFNNTTEDMLSTRFFGREDFLPRIRTALGTRGRTKNFHLALHGLSGIGKSQLALRYIRKYEDKYKIIIWIPAASEQKIQESLSKAAHGMHLPGCGLDVNTEVRVQNLLCFLERYDRPWLMVYDNVNDVVLLEKYKVASSHGHILITTWNPDHAVHPVREGIRVSAFSSRDAEDFFFRHLGARNIETTRPAKLDDCFKEWDGLPMALDQMSSCIREDNLTLETFSAMYDKHRARVHDMGKTYAAQWGYHNTTATAFSIRALSNHARTLLNAMCFLDPDHIFDEANLYGNMKETGVLINLFGDQIHYGTALKELVARSIIQRETAGLKIHRLVQAVTFDDMEANARRAAFRNLLKLMTAAYPEGAVGRSLHNYWDLCERYASHMEHLLRHRIAMLRDLEEGEMFEEDSELRKLIATCTWYMFEKCDFSSGDSLLYDARCLMAGDDSLSASLKFSLAGIRTECNRIIEARELMDEVIAIQERLLQRDDLSLGNSYYSAGIIEMELGNWKGAFQFYEKALNVQSLASRASKTDPVQEAATHENISCCFLRLKQTGSASKHAEKAYKLLIDAGLEDSIHIAEALFDLGNVRLAQNDIENGFGLHQRALDIRLRQTPSHDKTGYSLHKLGALLDSLGFHIEALEHLDKAIAIFERNFDAAPRIARSKYKQAKILEPLGRTAESYQAYAEASHLRESIKTFDAGSEEADEAYEALICSWFR